MTNAGSRQPLGSPAEVAEYLGVPEPTLRQWRRVGDGPRYFSIRRHIRYRWQDVEEWLERRAKGGAA